MRWQVKPEPVDGEMTINKFFAWYPVKLSGTNTMVRWEWVYEVVKFEWPIKYVIKTFGSRREAEDYKAKAYIEINKK